MTMGAACTIQRIPGAVSQAKYSEYDLFISKNKIYFDVTM